jgi:hypothetical protein
MKEKSQGRYISRMHGGALMQLIAMEVCTFVKVTDFYNHANFCVHVKGFGFYEGPNSGLSHRKLIWPLQQ